MAAEETKPEPVRIGFRLPNVLALTRPLREFISLILEWQQFDRETIEEIRLVATEVVNNSFEHASDRDRHDVYIEMLVDAEKWVLSVRDEGVGGVRQEDFEFGDRGPPDHLGDRGRGLYLIKCYSDEVVVRNSPAGGTEIAITKYRGQEA